ncbi:MAG: serine/threonine-protein kinase [Kineosporiaceae bacterium]
MTWGAALGPGDPARIGDYAVQSRIAVGGQGVVYLALGPDGQRVAVKVLHPEHLTDPASRYRQALEVAAARQVASFCTAVVIEARLDGDMPFIASEFVEGPTLGEHLRADGPLTGSALIRLAVGTATALAAIHRARIVHRDFKPANIILGPDGPRVIDFGIARELTVDALPIGLVVGTPAFMAPEQAGEGPVGPPADMFAWAATMIFAATGRRPFTADSLSDLVHRVLYEQPDLTGVPAGLIPVLTRCLNKDPARRPTAEQVLMLLLDHPEPGKPPPLSTGPGARPVHSSPHPVVDVVGVGADTDDLGRTRPSSPFPVPVGPVEPFGVLPAREGRVSGDGCRDASRPRKVHLPGGRRPFILTALTVMLSFILFPVLPVSWGVRAGPAGSPPGPLRTYRTQTGGSGTTTPADDGTPEPVVPVPDGTVDSFGTGAATAPPSAPEVTTGSGTGTRRSGMPVGDGSYFGFILAIQVLGEHTWAIVFDPVTRDAQDVQERNVDPQTYELVVDEQTFTEWGDGAGAESGTWNAGFVDGIRAINARDPRHTSCLGYQITLDGPQRVGFVKRYSPATPWFPGYEVFREPEPT